MAVSFFRDDNGNVADVAGLRPDFSTKCAASTGAGIAELDISATNVAGNRNQQGECMLRVAVVGANAAYFSLGAAATAPASNADMIMLAANSVNYVKAKSTDASAYHQQITGSSTVEVVAVV